MIIGISLKTLGDIPYFFVCTTKKMAIAKINVIFEWKFHSKY